MNRKTNFRLFNCLGYGNNSMEKVRVCLFVCLFFSRLSHHSNACQLEVCPGGGNIVSKTEQQVLAAVLSIPLWRDFRIQKQSSKIIACM